MSAVLAVSDASFEQDVLKASGPVLVDFWAQWCGPCKTIAPVLDELAQERAGALTIAKVNIDDNPTTPQQYGVRGIPTLLLFQDGELIATKVGALTRGQLTDWIDQSISGDL